MTLNPAPPPVVAEDDGDGARVCVCDWLCVFVAVATGVMVATGVAAGENVCDGVTTTFVGVTDCVTAGDAV